MKTNKTSCLENEIKQSVLVCVYDSADLEGTLEALFQHSVNSFVVCSSVSFGILKFCGGHQMSDVTVGNYDTLHRMQE